MRTNELILLHEKILQFFHVHVKTGKTYSSGIMLVCRVTIEAIHNIHNRSLLVVNVMVDSLMHYAFFV